MVKTDFFTSFKFLFILMKNSYISYTLHTNFLDFHHFSHEGHTYHTSRSLDAEVTMKLIDFSIYHWLTPLYMLFMSIDEKDSIYFKKRTIGFKSLDVFNCLCKWITKQKIVDIFYNEMQGQILFKIWRVILKATINDNKQ